MRFLGMTLFVLGSVAFGCSSGSSKQGMTFGAGTSDAIRRVCQSVAGLPCAEESQAECEAEGAEAAKEAEAAGCGPQLEAIANCYTQDPPTCDADGDLKVSDQCLKTVLAYAECDPSAICSSFSTEGSCEYDCGETAMSCEQGEVGWSCSCTAGSRSGSTFTSSASNPCERTVLNQNCG